jgi:hypothetical protein
METQITHHKKLSSERKRKLNSIGFKWDKGNFREERWERMYAKLKAYKRQHGHCQVKQREDFQLSVWVQRNKSKKHTLTPDQIDRLNQLGFKWSHEVKREQWDTMYNRLKEFKKQYGAVRVKISEDKSLYNWALDQRQLREQNKLSPDRLSRLNKIGFIWKGEIEKQKMAEWEKMYKAFQAFRKKHGADYFLKLKEDTALYRWVNGQASNEKMSAYKKKKLNAISFPWKRQDEYWDLRWQKMFDQLKVFKDKHGHCDIPQKYPENQRLANWVHGQRAKKLTQKKKEMLNSLGFSWKGEVKEKRWLQRVKEFTDLKRRNKHTGIRSHTQLYSWIYQQNKHYNRMPAPKKKLLKRLGIVPYKEWFR